MNYVLDTSVVVKWFSKVKENELNNALKIREDYLNKKIFLLFPDLLLYELANVLRYKPGFDSEKIKKSLKSVELMKIDIVPFSKRVGDKAIEFALKYDLTFYDAYFIALAETVGYKLITADEKYYKKIKELPYVTWLGNY